MKYVKELIEALQRFNPEARLTHEVEVDGVSPSTECTVIGGCFDDIEQLKEESRELDDRNNELIEVCNAIRKAAKVDIDTELSKTVIDLLDQAEV